MDAHELKAGFAHFYGTETWWKHPFNREFLYTDGVKFFAENAGGGAYWFLDIVATEIFQLQTKEPFLSITLHSTKGKAVMFADDGNGVKQWLRDTNFTDCPEGVWRFYLTDNVMMLPSEY